MKIWYKIKSYVVEAYLLNHYPSLLSFLLTKKRILVYYGFLGDKNFGDELVYESAKILFCDFMLIPYKKKMPIYLHIYSLFFYRNFSGIIIGGGTLIGPFWDKKFYLKLLELNMPVFFHGTGVHHKSIQDKDWNLVFKSNFFGGVRGPQSVKNLEDINKRIFAIGDAAFYLFNRKNINSVKNKEVLINVGTHAEFPYMDKERSEVSKLIDFFLGQGYQVKFLPMHSEDIKASRRLLREKNSPLLTVLPIPESYFECVKHFDNSCFAIGERLHFIVMSILKGVKFISINYSAKHEDLLESLGLDEYGFRPEDIYSENILNYFKENNSYNWESVFLKLSEYKKRQNEEFENFISEI